MPFLDRGTKTYNLFTQKYHCVKNTNYLCKTMQLKKLNLTRKHYLAEKTSLLRRLQAQTLHDATTPIGQINLFSKIALSVEPMI